MVNLTKDQICTKIARLSEELTTYQQLLDDINVQEESEFSHKIKSMVGKYYMQEFKDYNWYCRIDKVTKIQDSNIDGLYARCECVLVSIPKGPKHGYQATVDCIYVDESDIADYKPIDEGEFDAIVARFNQALKKTNK